MFIHSTIYIGFALSDQNISVGKMDRNFCGESCNSWFVNKTNK